MTKRLINDRPSTTVTVQIECTPLMIYGQLSLNRVAQELKKDKGSDGSCDPQSIHGSPKETAS